MKTTRFSICLLLLLMLGMVVPTVQAGRYDVVTFWVRNLTSYEYNVVVVGPSPFVSADSSHAASSKVFSGPVGQYGYTLQRQDGFIFRGDIFAPRDATIVFTITDGPGPEPVLTVTRSSKSPFGQGFSTSYTFAASMPDESFPPAGTTSAGSSAVPAWTPTPQPARLTRNDTYVVQPGDTIPKIAAMVGMWPSAVAAMNGATNGNIWPGQVLQFRAYTVQPGDTFFSVAAKLATTRALLLAANPGLNTEQLRHGQVLNVP